MIIIYPCIATSALKEVPADGSLSTTMWPNKKHVSLRGKGQLQQDFHSNLYNIIVLGIMVTIRGSN